MRCQFAGAWPCPRLKAAATDLRNRLAADISQTEHEIKISITRHALATPTWKTYSSAAAAVTAATKICPHAIEKSVVFIRCGFTEVKQSVLTAGHYLDKLILTTTVARLRCSYIVRYRSKFPATLFHSYFIYNSFLYSRVCSLNC